MAETHGIFVFDYDGVIADTEPLHWLSWAAILSPYGILLGWEEYCKIGQGISDTQIYAAMRKRGALPDAAEFARQNLERKRMVQAWSLDKSPIAQETADLLRSLDKTRIGLVTSSEQREVEPVLQAAGILDRFAAVVFGDEVTERKPSPAPYLLVAKKLGVRTGTAFEDSEPGLASARAAGFRAIAVERPQDLPRIVAQLLR